jgi:hypothetical protein
MQIVKEVIGEVDFESRPAPHQKRNKGPQPLHNMDQHCRTYGRVSHIYAYLALPRSPTHFRGVALCGTGHKVLGLLSLLARPEARSHHLSVSHPTKWQTHVHVYIHAHT